MEGRRRRGEGGGGEEEEEKKKIREKKQRYSKLHEINKRVNKNKRND